VAPVSSVIRGVPVTVTGSENTTCTAMMSPALYELLAVDEVTDDTVGAVASGDAIVTVIVCGELVSVVWLLPAVSVTLKLAAAVSVEVVAPLPAVALDVAVTVHTVEDVCTMRSMAEMLVRSKSVPAVVDRVEHVIASLPVTVKVIVRAVEVAAERASVTEVGAVVSTTIAFPLRNEFAAPGEAKVSVALFDDASRMVPPLSASAVVAV